MHAKPVPLNPYNPCPNPETSTIRYPSPFIPIRLPIFAVVLWINDRIVRLLSVGGGRNRHYARGIDVDSGSGKRVMSDATVESVEEGSGDVASAESLRSAARRHQTSGAIRLTDTRRRKAD